MTYTLTGLNLNTPYYLAMSTTDEFSQESAITPIISKTTPIPALPGAPTNFSAPNAGVM